jgi:hypothetical protein
MPIFLIIVLVVFIFVAPKFFRWLLLAVLLMSFVGFLMLKALLVFYGAGKGGANTGMFEELSIYFLMFIYTVPAGVVLVGLFAGGVLSLYRKLRVS